MQSLTLTLSIALAMMACVIATPLEIAPRAPKPPTIAAAPADLTARFSSKEVIVTSPHQPGAKATYFFGTCVTAPASLLVSKGMVKSPYDCLLKCAYDSLPFSFFAFPPGFPTNANATADAKTSCFCSSADTAQTIAPSPNFLGCAKPCVKNALFGCGYQSSDSKANSTFDAINTDTVFTVTLVEVIFREIAF
ncbi:hypothetical protein HDU76_005983 [Blyttiomyces sp. JEL0837]|nr:hypothetical protein HDU76_005983 [Blyttiomyces sp. JEL0837]